MSKIFLTFVLFFFFENQVKDSNNQTYQHIEEQTNMLQVFIKNIQREFDVSHQNHIQTLSLLESFHTQLQDTTIDTLAYQNKYERVLRYANVLNTNIIQRNKRVEVSLREKKFLFVVEIQLTSL